MWGEFTAQDRWMKQFLDRNFSRPEQRGRAAVWLVRIEFVIYTLIFLGVLIFILRVIF